jgi:nucleoside-diphosphate-sugar epimerase
VKHSQADITRAEQLLGYAPRVQFEDGLAHVVTWLSQQQVRVSR